MQRLSPMDASFYYSDDGRTHNDIGMVLLFTDEPLTRGELARLVEERLHLVPLFRKRVREVPMGAALPVWIDDTSFLIDRHVVETPIRTSIDETVGRIMSTQLDRNIPLWQVHLLTGEGDRWAVVVRMHHAMVDGVSSTEIVRVLLSTSPEPEVMSSPPWEPEREPTDAELLGTAGRDAAAAGLDMLQASAKAVFRPPSLPKPGAWPAGDLPVPPPPGLPVDPHPITGPVSARRTWARREISLDRIRDVRRRHSGTVNDVLLALSAVGFTALLRELGVAVDNRVIVALVPVSLRDQADAGGGNQVGGMPVQLPLGDVPLPDVLARVVAQTATFKLIKDAAPADALASAPGFVPPALLITGIRVAATAPAFLQTVVTNVPGPQHPLYLAGRRMRELSACIALWSPLRIAVAMLSYDGMVTISAVADPEAVPDVGVFLDGVEAGIADLETAARS